MRTNNEVILPSLKYFSPVYYDFRINRVDSMHSCAT